MTVLILKSGRIKEEYGMTEKRFELDYNFNIVDNLNGKRYINRKDIVKLLNDVNDRADRNAELSDCVAQKEFCDAVQKILAKYEISNLEKLDRILLQQRVW